MKFNVWSVVSFLFLLYIANSIWHLYSLYFPPLCQKTVGCLDPALAKTDDLQLRLYHSPYGRSIDFESNELFNRKRFDLSKELSETFEIVLPAKTRKNGTLWIHVFLLPSNFVDKDPRRAEWHLERKSLMTFYTIPVAETIQLMIGGGGDQSDDKKSKKETSGSTGQQQVVSHWRSVLPLTGVGESLHFDWDKIPGELGNLLQLDNKRRYLPIFYLDELSFRVRDLQQLKSETEKVNLTVKYQPASVGKLRLLITAYHSTESLKGFGFTEKDVDEVKGIFTDTNFYFLALTFFVAAVHLLLDFLAFKNDINFWRHRKTMVGLSTKALMWRCFSQCVIVFYLMDENTSLLVLIPAGIGALIELWKLTKAFKIRVSFERGYFRMPTFMLGDPNKAEQETAEFDAQGMKYLACILVPLCLGGAVYSLLYTPHKSWYSWFIQSLANAVYAFGFLFMLPQLFINYKLKSVAHLPWRAFMYKAFNTFIDDLFAFIIYMPTAHRVACFRDDIVFLVYLYQRYLYPVDKTRVNEYGESFEIDDVAVKQKVESKKVK